MKLRGSGLSCRGSVWAAFTTIFLTVAVALAQFGASSAQTVTVGENGSEDFGALADGNTDTRGASRPGDVQLAVTPPGSFGNTDGILTSAIEVEPASMHFTRNEVATGAAISASRTSSAEYVLLEAKVAENGQLPVIVRMNADFMPEGALNSLQAVSRQRDAIAWSQDLLLSDLSGQGVTGVKRFQSMPYMAMTVNTVALNSLRQSPLVVSVIEDVAEAPTLDLSVPLINGDEAWAAGYTGAGQTVAVLDTGVDSGHPFLGGKVVSEACYSTTNLDAATVCPNGLDSQIGIGAGVNCTVAGGCSHGTHVAGIAAGAGDTFDGVAPGANVIAIQVFSEFDCSGTPCVLSYVSDQMLGLERVYALRNDFSIASVNMSLGGGSYASACDSDPRKAAIDNLRSEGIATVIASGNDGYTSSISAPACISSAISVGATTSHSPADVVAGYSNSASILDLLAPGSSINSSVPGGGYSSWNGTSMATPHVAGAWAVLKSQIPDASVDDVFYALESTGVPITDTRNSLVKPRIDVHSALLAAAGKEILTVHSLGDSDLTVTGVSIAAPVLARTQAESTCDWLVLDAPETPFTVSPDDSFALGVSVDVCEAQGTYTKTVQIASDDPNAGTLDIPVTLQVNGPLSVTLGWFVANQDGGWVDFQWEMVTEQGVAGFNLLAGHGDQTTTQLNAELIPSTAIDSVTPTRYEFSAQTAATRFFLQEVSVEGNVTQYGPFSLTTPGPVIQPDVEDISPKVWLPMVAH